MLPLCCLMLGTRDPNTVMPKPKLGLLRLNLGAAPGMSLRHTLSKARLPAKGEVKEPKSRD